jgi:hypothetical protein
MLWQEFIGELTLITVAAATGAGLLLVTTFVIHVF